MLLAVTSTAHTGRDTARPQTCTRDCCASPCLMGASMPPLSYGARRRFPGEGAPAALGIIVPPVTTTAGLRCPRGTGGVHRGPPPRSGHLERPEALASPARHGDRGRWRHRTLPERRPHGSPVGRTWLLLSAPSSPARWSPRPRGSLMSANDGALTLLISRRCPAASRHHASRSFSRHGTAPTFSSADSASHSHRRQSTPVEDEPVTPTAGSVRCYRCEAPG
jgi:hypothetical protein